MCLLLKHVKAFFVVVSHIFRPLQRATVRLIKMLLRWDETMIFGIMPSRGPELPAALSGARGPPNKRCHDSSVWFDNRRWFRKRTGILTILN